MTSTTHPHQPPRPPQPPRSSILGFSEDAGPSSTSVIILAIVVIFLVVTLLYFEYKDHDCIRGKPCTHRRPEITEGDSPLEAIEKIQEMNRSNNSVTFWRQALLLAVLLPVPLIYLLYSRFPTFLEWGFAGLFIFLAVYLSYSWIWSHYFNPNALTISNNLSRLSDRLQYRKRADDTISLEYPVEDSVEGRSRRAK